MKHERERSLYQMIAVGCLFLSIFTGWKYSELKRAYYRAEIDKVYYCQEYHKAMCSIDLFLDADTTRSNISFDKPDVTGNE